MLHFMRRFATSWGGKILGAALIVALAAFGVPGILATLDANSVARVGDEDITATDFMRLYQQNRAYWNLGCANQRNLAAMVDNPADLVQPRGESPAYTARRTVAIDKYRKGESPSGLYPSSYESSKLSDVGK